MRAIFFLDNKRKFKEKKMKRFVWSTLLISVSILTLILFGCSEEPELLPTEDFETPKGAIRLETVLETGIQEDTYTNVKFCFQISRPNPNWSMSEGRLQEDPLIILESEKVGGTANVFADFGVPPNADLEQVGGEVFEIYKDELRRQGIPFQIISEGPSRLNGLKAYEVVYTANWDGVLIKLRQLLILNQEIFYVLTFGAATVDYGRAKVELNQIAQSFRLIAPPPAAPAKGNGNPLRPMPLQDLLKSQAASILRRFR